MKKKQTKIIAGALTLALGTSLLAGCSSDKKETESGKIQLELFSNKQESIKTYEKLIAEFEKKNPNIDIKLVAPPEAETVLKKRLTKDDLPDIMSIGGNATFGELARAGVFKDFADTDSRKKVLDAYITMTQKLVGKDKEAVYGLPYATNANGIIYNKAKLKELGLEVPKTWDELIAALETAKKAGEIPIYFTLKDSWTSMVIWNSISGNTVPGDFATKKSDGKTSFVKSDYKEVVKKFETLIQYGHKGNFGTGYNDGNVAFAKGQGVFYLQGNWAIPEILKANPDMEIGMAAFPVTKKAEDNKLISGVDVILAEAADTEHPKEAQKFIDFMLEHETAEKYITEQKAFSALDGVIQKDENLSGVVPNFESGKITSFVDHYYPAGIGMDGFLQQHLIDASKGKSDSTKLLNTLDKEWDKVENR